MKKILALFLAVHLISGSLLAAEIGKLPFLCRHFFQHSSGPEPTTFIDFLTLHYTGNQHNSSDPEHHHLPLHALQIVPSTAALRADPAVFVLKLPLVCSLSTLFSNSDRVVPSEFRDRLLKPPTFC